MKLDHAWFLTDNISHLTETWNILLQQDIVESNQGCVTWALTQFFFPVHISINKFIKMNDPYEYLIVQKQSCKKNKIKNIL